ncbi:cysteine desulfurase family protein [Alteribacillus sp. HJP-4]|uniref:cysteine desulfurase family protein n=1 Tax=Alteribacillus sp. HJP-4 TaxID=2775394 RepID=UPI0035CCCBBC
MKTVYADHAATTPVHKDSAMAMMEVMQKQYGNPSSIHRVGREARQILDRARIQLAHSISADPQEIVLTSGGTEADNLAIVGFAYANKDKGRHIITSKIEHHAVLHSCELLEKQGFEVTYLPVNECGVVNTGDVEAAITDETILLTIMHGNNEVGTLQPLSALAEIAAKHEIGFHTDVVQSYGMVPLNVQEIPITLLSVSSHKVNGPKGAGFLYVRKNTPLAPSIIGGEQERKRRAGTENVAAAAGFAAAVKLFTSKELERNLQYASLTEHFLQSLDKENVQYKVNGKQAERLPHIVNLYFPGANIESFLVNLDLAGVCASSGSACTAGSLQASHVLKAMYKDGPEPESSIRFSFGYLTTKNDTEYIASEIKKIQKRTRSLS